MSEPLQYEHRSATTKRKWKGRVVIAAVVITLGVLAVLRGPVIVRHVQLLYWQRQCATYHLPADKVRAGHHGIFAGVIQPMARFGELLDRRGLGVDTVFLHRLERRDGTGRLVIISWMPFGLGDSDLLQSEVFQLAHLLGDAKSLNAGFPAEGSLLELPKRTLKPLVFAGQPDPNDVTHFTIRVTTVESETIIDGWLRDDDTVLLEARPPVPIPPPASSPALSR